MDVPLSSGHASRSERLFDLALPAELSGQTPLDVPYAGAGEIASLSADEAVIRVPAPVVLGTRLAILLRIPMTRFLERPLEMSLSGTVRSCRPGPTGPDNIRLVLVRLDRAYRIRPLPA